MDFALGSSGWGATWLTFSCWLPSHPFLSSAFMRRMLPLEKPHLCMMEAKRNSVFGAQLGSQTLWRKSNSKDPVLDPLPPHLMKRSHLLSWKRNLYHSKDSSEGEERLLWNDSVSQQENGIQNSLKLKSTLEISHQSSHFIDKKPGAWRD